MLAGLLFLRTHRLLSIVVLIATAHLATAPAATVQPGPETPFSFTTPDRARRLCAAATPEQRREALDLADKALRRALQPMPHIQIDGLLPGEGIRDASEEALLDWTAARDSLDVKWIDLATQLNPTPPLWQRIEMGLP